MKNFTILTLSFLLLLVKTANINAALPPLRADNPVESWRFDEYTRQYHQESLKGLNIPKSPDYLEYAKRGETYGIGQFVTPTVIGLSFATRTTGDIVFVEEIAKILDHLEVRLSDSDGDGYKNFVYKHADTLYQGSDSSVADELKAHAGIALATYALQENTINHPEYRSKVDFWVAYLEEDFIAKWGARTGNLESLKTSNTEADQAFVNLFVYLYRLTGKQEYLKLADIRAGEIVNGLICDSEVCVWSAETGKDLTQSQCQSIIPASNTLLFMAELNAQGYFLYSDQILQRVAGAARANLIPSVEEGNAPATICAGSPAGKWSVSRVFGYGPWVLLSKWDPDSKIKEYTNKAYQATSGNVIFPLFALFAAESSRDTILAGDYTPSTPSEPAKISCANITARVADGKLIGTAQNCTPESQLYRLVVTHPSGERQEHSVYALANVIPLEVNLDSNYGTTSIDVFYNAKFLGRVDATKPVPEVNAEQIDTKQIIANSSNSKKLITYTVLGLLLVAFGVIVSRYFIKKRSKNHPINIASPNE